MADQFSSNLSFLEDQFLQDARVLDPIKGYVSVASFNLRMKPAILQAAGAAIAHFFANEQITSVHGIPHSGNYVATAVAMALGGEVRLHSSRKDQNIPAAWKDVYRQEVKSFTTSSGGTDVFAGINLSFVKKGDRVLLIDDVCAHGTTGVKIVQGLIDYGVEVMGFAVLFDKIFQGGLEQVAQLGVKTFSCVRIQELKEHDTVILKKHHAK